MRKKKEVLLPLDCSLADFREYSSNLTGDTLEAIEEKKPQTVRILSAAFEKYR